MGLEGLIWFEKHRPKSINEMTMNVNHKKAFEQYIMDKSFPHLLLEGPPGSGKTTITQVLLSSIPCTVLSLNASGQDRGVDTVKTKITQFAGSLAMDGKLKVVFLDEADGLSKDALFALKNTMETYSKSCRFILTCNHVDKIIDPIQSRCTKYTFGQFPKKRLNKLLTKILVEEGVNNTTDSDIDGLITRFYPDVRSIINNLQAACVTGSFNAKALGSLQVDPNEIGELLLKGRLQSLRQYVAGTTDFTFIYKWLFNVFLYSNVPSEQQADVALAILDFSAKDQQVPDREMQIAGCFLSIMMAMGIEYSFSN